jgi:DNA-binding transcriptional MerR regulator
LAEYRLDELARISGVSARNIRAYRERGLLDAPRRVGRSAFYDDYHLSQLRTINQLLRRGFNSAHIAEFFTSMREGADLADILGIQRALLGARGDDDSAEDSDDDRAEDSDDDREGVSHAGTASATDGKSAARPRTIDIDPGGKEAAALIDYGLAERREGRVVVLDPTIAEILGRAADQMLYVRGLLRIYDATRNAVENLAEAFGEALVESVEARFGADDVPRGDAVAEVRQIGRDYRELWSRILSNRLDESVQRQLSTAASGYAAGVLLSELREP